MGIKFNPFTGQFDLVGSGGGGVPGATIELDNLGVTAVNADINPGVDDTINIGSSSLQFAEGHFTPASLAIGTGLTPAFWGSDLPGLIIDGESADALAAFGAGIVYKGTDAAPFLIATQDRDDGLSTPSIYVNTGISTVTFGRTGDLNVDTGSTNSVAEQSGNQLYKTGENALGTTGFMRFLTGSGVSSGGILLQTGTGSITRGSIELKALNTQVTNPLILLNQTTLELREGTGGGTNAVKLRAPATLGADYTLTFPADDGNSGEVLSTNGSGTLSWVAASGANTTLSNLTSTVAVNQNLQPDGNGTRNLGALSFNWATFYARQIFIRDSSGTATSLQIQSSGQTSPSGVKSNTTINNSLAGNALTLYTANNVGSSNSAAMEIETGNVVDGISGNIVLRVGVPSGTGSKGNISVNSNILGNTNTITVGATATDSVITGVSHPIDASADIISSNISGESNELYNSIFSNIIGGANNILGNAPYGLDTSLIVGDSNDIIASTSVVGGQSNVVTVGMSNNLLVGSNASLAAQVTNSVITGSTNSVTAGSSGVAGSIISGQGLVNDGGQIGNSIITGQDNTVSANLTNSILLGITNTLGGASIHSVIGGTLVSLDAGTESSIIVGESITSDISVQHSIIVGEGHSIDTGCTHNAVFGQNNIVSDFTGLLLSGNAQESSRDYQTLVGDSFLSSSDTMFGIGGGAGGNLFEVTDVGLVKRDAGGLRVKSRSDAAATVTVDAETDYAVICTNGGAVTVNLPAGVDGMEYKIKARGATTATVTPAAGNIDGAATYPLASEEGIILVYNTGEWSTF